MGQVRVLIPPLVDTSLPFLPPRSWRTHRLDGQSMGTVWSLRAHAPPLLPAPAIADAVARGLARAIALFSLWEPASEICRLNADPAAEVALSAEFVAVLAPLLQLAAQTGGASDPTLGRPVALWGFGAAGPRPAGSLPAPDELALARRLSGAGEVALLPGGVLRRPPGLWLDLGGSAKGWAADQVSANLSQLGVRAHLFELGGELVAAGLGPDMLPWWVDIERPGTGGTPLRLGLFDLAVASSGDWRRGFTHEGRRYAHTIDPATGAPLEGAVASVTVLHGSALMADALASALMVLGPAAGTAYAARTGLAALITERAPGGPVDHMSPALRRMMQDDTEY